MGTFEQQLLGFLPLIIVFAVIGSVLYVYGRDAKASNLAAGDAAPIGVQGWLRFFVLKQIVIGPLLTVAGTAKNISTAARVNPDLLSDPGWTQYIAGTWIYVALIVGWSWYVAFRLKRDLTPKGVLPAKLFLLLTPFSLLIDVLLVTATLDMAVTSSMMGEWVGAFFGNAASSAIWYVYFKRSRRVRNTYQLGTQGLPSVAGYVHPVSGQPRAEPDFRGLSELVRSDIDASAEARLDKLRSLLARGLITQADFDVKKAEILRSI